MWELSRLHNVRILVMISETETISDLLRDVEVEDDSHLTRRKSAKLGLNPGGEVLLLSSSCSLPSSSLLAKPSSVIMLRFLRTSCVMNESLDHSSASGPIPHPSPHLIHNQ